LIKTKKIKQEKVKENKKTATIFDWLKGAKKSDIKTKNGPKQQKTKVLIKIPFETKNLEDKDFSLINPLQGRAVDKFIINDNFF